MTITMTDEEREVLDILVHIGLMSLFHLLMEAQKYYAGNWQIVGDPNNLSPNQIFEQIMGDRDFSIQNEKLIEYGKKLKAYTERDNTEVG